MIIKDFKELLKVKRIDEKELVSLSKNDKETLLKETYLSLDKVNTIKNKTLCEFFIGFIISHL